MSVAQRSDGLDAPTTLLDDSVDLAMTAERCNLEYWFKTAASDALAGTIGGRRPTTPIPSIMMRPGPLREAILDEFAFRARSEETATRAIGWIVQSAPTSAGMDFYGTQLIDEARHGAVFRSHLVDLGLPRVGLDRAISRLVGDRQETILRPLEDLGRECGTSEDFIGGVIVLAVIAEGALAPAAELSERKWRVFDPAAAEICAGANADEIRHLTVGSMLVREHLRERPEERERLRALIARGMTLWQEIPIAETIVRREELFQQGIAEHGHLLGGYELVPGRPLAETTVQERLAMLMNWSTELRSRRLAFMGIGTPGAAPGQWED